MARRKSFLCTCLSLWFLLVYLLDQYEFRKYLTFVLYSRVRLSPVFSCFPAIVLYTEMSSNSSRIVCDCCWAISISIHECTWYDPNSVRNALIKLPLDPTKVFAFLVVDSTCLRFSQLDILHTCSILSSNFRIPHLLLLLSSSLTLCALIYSFSNALMKYLGTRNHTNMYPASQARSQQPQFYFGGSWHPSKGPIASVLDRRLRDIIEVMRTMWTRK